MQFSLQPLYQKTSLCTTNRDSEVLKLFSKASQEKTFLVKYLSLLMLLGCKQQTLSDLTWNQAENLWEVCKYKSQTWRKNWAMSLVKGKNRATLEQESFGDFSLKHKTIRETRFVPESPFKFHTCKGKVLLVYPKSFSPWINHTVERLLTWKWLLEKS